MKTSLFYLFLLISLVACEQPTANTADDQEPSAFAHTEPTMIDVVGTYKGDLPCENCDKEIVTVEFLMDKSCFETIARVNGDGSSASIGTWELNGDQVTLDVRSGSKTFTVKGNQLQTNIDGKVHVLTKQTEE